MSVSDTSPRVAIPRSRATANEVNETVLTAP